jgi:eukaryotic-like serine/threonine-protein kinase
MTPERWQKIQEVFAEVLEQKPAARAAYLNKVCTDTSLRQQVELMIVAHEQGDSGFLEPPVGGSNEVLKSGTKLGPYEILSRLGAGGMGVVYRARDSRLERDVAIKVLSPGQLPDKAARKRFHKEALALAKLNHPNIATVYDVGDVNDTDYLVMECVPGHSLAEESRSRAAIEKETVAIGLQIAAALEEAHEQNIVHRDLKPGNIMVTPKRQVKVLDFGLAKILWVAGESSRTETFTQTENMAGTLPYMAPEQLRGEPADARTDIHALGAVLFEIVTGKRLFQESSVPQLTDAILHRQPVAPRALNARVSPELERIILKCLEKDRENRYQSAKELAVDLRRLSISSTAPVVAGARPASRSRMALPVAGALLVAVVLAVGGYFYLHRTPKLTEKDSIVLADFTNTTGDAVFDGTLQQGLSVQLEQSPFLSIISDEQVQRTLQMMGQKPDARLTPEIARELCQRTGSAAVLDGSIAQIGTQYLLTLKAVNCSSGESLASTEAQAGDKNHVLDALGKTASEIRNKLGESLSTLQKFDTPLEQATTPSLEALKAFSTGRRVLFSTGFAATIPFFKHAIELDPNFALAYAWLGSMYGNIGESGLAAYYTRKAYELRDRTSEAEKYFISANFYVEVTGNMENAQQTCELWIQAYPRAELPHDSLSALILPVSGQYEKAVEEAREAIRVNPDFPVSFLPLMFNYIALNRLDEAKAAYRQALKRKLDDAFYPLPLYQIAFLQNDAAGMAQQAASTAGSSGVEDEMLGLEAESAAYSGRLRDARELSRRAVDSAERAGEKETAATYSAMSGLREALFGNADDARRHATLAIVGSTSVDVQYGAALALAYVGDEGRAQALADDLGKRFPENTIWQFSYLPTLRAKLAVSRGNASEALESLRATTPYELGQMTAFAYPWTALYPVYVRGEAYLAAHQGSEAAAEFQKILDHRGIVVIEPIGALAHLGLARAYALSGDTAKAKTAYQDFLALWRDADPDIPILKQAKAEYAQLR